MIVLLLWPALGLVCLCLALSYPLAVRPALDHRRHSRTLAHIALLERELGYDVPLSTRIDRELERENQAWYDAELAKIANYSATATLYPARWADARPEPEHLLYGDCVACGRRVAINAGRCSPAPQKCAKRLWLADQL